MHHYPFKARVNESHSSDCERIAFLVEWGKKKEAERLTKARVWVVVIKKQGWICQRRTYRFEDSIDFFFRRLQSVMDPDVDMLEAEAPILIRVDGNEIKDWKKTKMGDIVDVDSMFEIVLR